MSAADAAALALSVAAAVFAATVAARALKIPYTVGLVVAGLVIGAVHHPSPVAFSPSIVMHVFLPPLLFAAAWEMDLAQLRRWWLLVALLATVGVGAGVAGTYLVLRYVAGMDGGVALVFGALVAATDPVAVIALFRELRVDRALSTIVEGESLFNDGVAVVLVRSLALGAAGGAASSGLSPGFDLVAAARVFAVSGVGGAAAGIVVGLAAAALLRATRVPVLDILLTVAAAFGAYAAADALHASGIVAVIGTGLTCAAARSRTDARAVVACAAVDRFWELAALVANSVLFVLVGLSIDIRSLAATGAPAGWAIAAVLAGRALVVYGLTSVAALAGSRAGAGWRHVIALGGLRGALCMALVLGLPEDFHDRATLVAMVYSVVAFTLVAQGLALRPVMRALGVGFAAGERREGFA